MTYFSEEETKEVAQKMRQGEFPCDVMHLDTGWFDKDWVCDWTFNRERFPDPAQYMKDMKEKGFRITLWQTPYQRTESPLFEEARQKGYIALPKGETDGSDFAGRDILAPIDFTNPEAVTWYQEKLETLLKTGASGIKTDFGEDLYSGEDFKNIPVDLLHNVYALLYQKAAFEITEKTTGEGIIWARSSWAGSQRYPVHWGGDAACTWDGLAASIKGGLHFGLSGFAFWSHDVPGFHGVPDFMNSWPADDLYVRWTQVGVFTSHLRYHGAQPREPYEYPEIADTVRKWLNLRYALIPYLVDQSEKTVKTGYPIFRAMIFHHQDDPFCWHIDDQFYCGDSLLIAPVLNSKGIRDVYLPQGKWIDLWTGEQIQGPVMLKKAASSIERIPVYAVKDAEIRVYPEKVLCTDAMDLNKAEKLIFDADYKGLTNSIVGKLTNL
jgi:alpha-D-xyloside xylohydrolase